MITANINEIKAKLSHYVNLAAGGETVLICNHNIPVAELKPVIAKDKKKLSGKRQFGQYKENLVLPSDFNETSQEIISSFYSTDCDTKSDITS